MELRWHPSSGEHIAAEHGVTWEEAVEAYTPPTVTRPGNSPGTNRVLGQTYEGRHLSLIVSPDEGVDTAYLVTARDMDKSERAEFRRRRGKG